MTVPYLSTYSPGIGVYPADWANTVVQGGSMLADLRAFPGLSNMNVWLIGTTAANDGGQGMFYWNSTATAADDGGTTVIAPSGLSTGRWLRQTNIAPDCLNIVDYGGDPTGVVACDTALTLAYAALPTNGGKICFPAGRFVFNAVVNYVYPVTTPYSVTLSGAGSDATTLYWAASAGLAFALSSDLHTFHMNDLSMITGSLNTYSGLTITNGMALGIFEPNDLTRVTWRGTNTNFCWAYAVILNVMSNINVIGCQFAGASIAGVLSGIGAIAQGSALVTFNASVIQNFTDCDFVFLNEGIVYGDYIQGMTVSQSNFTQVNVGIIQPAGAGAVLIGAQLALNNSQFGTLQDAIVIEGSIGDIIITGNLFYANAANANGIFITQNSHAVRVVITGNSFEGNNSVGTNGFVIAGVASSVSFVGNTIYGFVAGFSCLSTSQTFGMTITGNTFNGITKIGTVGVILDGTNAFAAIVGNSFITLATGVQMTGSTSSNNVQSNSYGDVTLNTDDTGAGNVIGGGSA